MTSLSSCVISRGGVSQLMSRDSGSLGPDDWGSRRSFGDGQSLTYWQRAWPRWRDVIYDVSMTLTLRSLSLPYRRLSPLSTRLSYWPACSNCGDCIGSVFHETVRQFHTPNPTWSVILLKIRWSEPISYITTCILVHCACVGDANSMLSLTLKFAPTSPLSKQAWSN